MPAARLQIHLFGPFRLLRDNQLVAGFDQPRLQHLLAYLALHRDAPISRLQLAFCFWPDTTDQQALKNLRTLLARLRQALPDADDFLSITPQTLQWRPDAPVGLDVAEFEAALARAEVGEPANAPGALAAAVAAYTGELLPDCYDDWSLPLRQQMRQAYGKALERLVLALEEQRDYSRALPYAQHLVRHDPLHEAAYRHLIRLHLAQGNRAEAQRVYHACEAMLQQEFGIAPGRATRRLYERLLALEDAVVRAGSASEAKARPADLPLVGRTTEWARMVALWQAAAHGRAQLVLLAGEAGIGKTRLAEELYDWVSRQGGATAAAACYPAGATLAYAAVAEWLSDPALKPRLAALDDVWLSEVTRILPALRVEHPRLTPPGPLTEAWQRTRLFAALARAVLGAESDRGEPLLLFLDDLQWADRETLDWLVYLLHHHPGAALLIVGTVRQHEVGVDHPWTAARLALTRAGLLAEIALAPLDAAETARLAASVAGRALDADEASQIYRDTEGHPLFVVEVVRAREEGGLLAAGATAHASASFRPASPILPPKVRAVIRWRLAALSPEAHALVQAAAVIGRKFSFAVLARAGAQEEAAVVQCLDELWQRQLVRALGTGAYDFSHEGIRAVVYQDISPARRCALHLAVAQALEALHGNDPDAYRSQIARHYELAGQPRAAIASYRRAAAWAQRIYANAEALQLYQHLLESEIGISLSAGERCEVMLAQAEVWKMTGYWARAHKINRAVLVAAEASGDARLLTQAQRALADVLRLLGYYDEALAWLATAEAGFKAAADWRGMISALWTMGQIHWSRGNHAQALAVLERQRQIATEIHDQQGICEALETMGMVYWSQGAWDRSADCCLRAITIARPLAHKQVLVRASLTLGNVRSSQRRFAEAVRGYLDAGAQARQIDDRQTMSWATANMAMVLARRGDYVRALTGYERSLRDAWDIGDRWTACLNVAGLANVHERLGQVAQAESLYRAAIDFGMRLGIPNYLAGMFVALARLLLRLGRAAEARDLYGEALQAIAGVTGERLAGEDTRFDARVLGIRLRHALGESSVVEAAAELRELLRDSAPHQQAALHYELWRLVPGDAAARDTAAAFYRGQWAETGDDESRRRYCELTGETLSTPPPLPDVAELIPEEPDSQLGPDLACLLDSLKMSFEQAL